MKLGTANNRQAPRANSLRRRNKRPNGREAGFTLAEVLAALMFMAIVIPAAIEALHIASVSGEIAVRKSEAARIADAVLTENTVTTNWNQTLSGSKIRGGHEYHWTLNSAPWQADSGMQLVSAEVKFSAQGREYSVRLSTLASTPVSGAVAGLPQ